MGEVDAKESTEVADGSVHVGKKVNDPQSKLEDMALDTMIMVATTEIGAQETPTTAGAIEVASTPKAIAPEALATVDAIEKAELPVDDENKTYSTDEPVVAVSEISLYPESQDGVKVYDPLSLSRMSVPEQILENLMLWSCRHRVL